MLAAVLALSSCGGRNGEERFLEIRAALLAADEIRTTADVRADYGQRVYEFTLMYEGDISGGRVTVVSPEEIRGITAVITAGNSTVEYDGTSFDTGNIVGGVSPVGAVPLLLEQWSGGYVTGWGREKLNGRDVLMVSAPVSGKIDVRMWFYEDSGLPARAELSEGGYTRLYCDFYDTEIITNGTSENEDLGRGRP